MFHPVITSYSIHYTKLYDQVNSDFQQLQTVLTNFLNNAIHHVDEKKSIVIKTETAENKAIRVSVFNTGINIPEDEINNIWDSFYKVDKARTRRNNFV